MKPTRIDIAGFPGSPIFSDPATGLYSVDLKGGSHKLTVSAELGGYVPETRQLTVPPDATVTPTRHARITTAAGELYRVRDSGLAGRAP